MFFFSCFVFFTGINRNYLNHVITQIPLIKYVYEYLHKNNDALTFLNKIEHDWALEVLLLLCKEIITDNLLLLFFCTA